MSPLDLLISALGLGALAGLNLYLTVFLLSLSLRMDWLTLGPKFGGLTIFEHPVVFYTALGLMVIEFVADKVPWVDSAWDVLHSFIRPAGAAFLGFSVMGDLDPAWVVTATLLTGGVGLAGHATKAGSRLLLNSSPEPVTNTGASLLEDGLVIGGFSLWALSPWIAFAFLLGLLLVLIFLLTRSYRWLLNRRRAKTSGVTGSGSGSYTESE